MNTTQENTPAQVAAAIAHIIRTTPNRWNQRSWFKEVDIPLTPERPHALVDLLRESLNGNTCGSTACVAGWAAILTAPDGSAIIDTSMDPRMLFPDGSTVKISALGQRALGLSESDADWLFDSIRSERRVLEALDWLAAGHSRLPLHLRYGF